MPPGSVGSGGGGVVGPYPGNHSNATGSRTTTVELSFARSAWAQRRSRPVSAGSVVLSVIVLRLDEMLLVRAIDPAEPTRKSEPFAIGDGELPPL